MRAGSGFPALLASAPKSSAGRFSGGTHGFVVGHITPEAYEGGPLAAVKDGDKIVIDAKEGLLTLDVSPEMIANRLKDWKQPAPKYTSGVLAKYAALVSTASEGAMTDAGPRFNNASK